MDESTKYYTPSLEEFCQDFKYEWNYKDEGWVETTFDISTGSTDSMAGDYYEFSPNCPQTKCRVKCLDREDIESCGFESLGSGWYNLKEVPGKLGYFLYVRLRMWGENSFIKAYRYDPKDMPQEIENEERFLFSGNIRNINELQRIMKMIHIK